MIMLTQQLYDTLVESLRGVPNTRLVNVPAGTLRAVLREIKSEGLPQEDDAAPAPVDQEEGPADGVV